MGCLRAALVVSGRWAVWGAADKPMRTASYGPRSGRPGPTARSRRATSSSCGSEPGGSHGTDGLDSLAAEPVSVGIARCHCAHRAGRHLTRARCAARTPAAPPPPGRAQAAHFGSRRWIGHPASAPDFGRPKNLTARRVGLNLRLETRLATGPSIREYIPLIWSSNLRSIRS